MIDTILYIDTSIITTAKLRKVIAYLLLFLVSCSFLIEHMPYLEGDLLELVENAEKEENKKDKKVIPFNSNIQNQQDVSLLNKQKYHYALAFPLTICIDITTPPPKFA